MAQEEGARRAAQGAKNEAHGAGRKAQGESLKNSTGRNKVHEPWTFGLSYLLILFLELCDGGIVKMDIAARRPRAPYISHIGS